MNEEKKVSDDCLSYRRAFDECRDEAWVDEHRKQCSLCKLWADQSQQIGELSRALPQFDVPEALTQRILTAVDLERNVEHSGALWDGGPLSGFLLPGAVALGMVALFTELPFEPVEGIISWIVGILVVAAFGMLITSGGRSSATEISST